ncbi:unnamed protein product [Bursaphelenchus xylophilus]|uniref:START domain-containing protein 10 n=1 Tax=Bursaphelenchus xylophilus TaxID=6326 RepID=A0A1I7STT7_BURXY|nr:unnamed protein product [Bursaphelenchus xylophilus]CAG9107979.1 unnamed protein product [Bursaphelenchus xylophilus]
MEKNSEILRGIDINEVKVFEDSQYEHARYLAESNEGWDLVYQKKSAEVWTKEMPESYFKMIKAATTLNVSADVVYDVLHDPDYRSSWDKYMVKAEDIGVLNPNNDLCYYALASVPPIKSRDFVMQRSWLDIGNEKFICTRSVWHDDYPPTRSFIRGFIYLTVYFIKFIDENSCQVTYLTYSDPKGKLPSWLINRITKIIAPKVLKKLHKACLNYEAWKRSHNPLQKPWRYPEQLEGAPRVDLSKCVPKHVVQDIVDETSLQLDCDEIKED